MINSPDRILEATTKLRHVEHIMNPGKFSWQLQLCNTPKNKSFILKVISCTREILEDFQRNSDKKILSEKVIVYPRVCNTINQVYKKEGCMDEFYVRSIEDRLRNIEARLPRNATLEEPAFDGTGGHQLIVKSSVASTEVAATTGDDAHTMAGGNNGGRYPVDYITESTPCELHVTFMGLDMKIAVGIALPIGPKPTYHCRAVPQGDAIVGVDEVLNPTFEPLKLDHPAGSAKMFPH